MHCLSYIGGFIWMIKCLQKPIGIHKVQVTSRSHASITGVKDVLSFDAGEVLLETGKEYL